MFSQSPDHPCWMGSSCGMFSTASAYDLINKKETDLEGWGWFWKIKIPAKFKTFLLLILLNKLLTNLPRFNKSSEGLDVVTKSKELWGYTHKSRLWRVRVESPTADWISFRLKSKKNVFSGEELPWNIVFYVTPWQIWKTVTNFYFFDNTGPVVLVNSTVIISYANEINIVQAFKSPLTNGFSRPTPIHLVPSCAGKIKLNTDGYWYQSNRNAGFGGIFRDSNG